MASTTTRECPPGLCTLISLDPNRTPEIQPEIRSLRCSFLRKMIFSIYLTHVQKIASMAQCLWKFPCNQFLRQPHEASSFSTMAGADVCHLPVTRSVPSSDTEPILKERTPGDTCCTNVRIVCVSYKYRLK